MRINFLRIGLLLVIIGAVLLVNFWTAPLPEYGIISIGEVKPGETVSYSLFMAPVGSGNLIIGYATLPGRSSSAPIPTEVVLPIHLVVTSPSNVTLVDVEVVTPYTTQLSFNERGEYIVHATNMGNEQSAIPVGLNFPREGNVVNREADKFLVSLLLTVSGLVLFCLGLGMSLFSKHVVKSQ
jgi:hypothetical protein